LLRPSRNTIDLDEGRACNTVDRVHITVAVAGNIKDGSAAAMDGVDMSGGGRVG
jgi:hypothetical protein